MKNDEPNSDLILPAEEQRRRQPQEEISYEIGDWYWVPSDEKGQPPWLGCVLHVGSNYVLFRGPVDERSSYGERVHFDNMDKCRPEPEAARIIAEKVAEQRKIIGEAMKQIQAVTGRLAIGERVFDSKALDSEAQALSVYRGGSMEKYKQALISAKDKTLPDLFNAIKEASGVMRTWLSADLLPLEGQADKLESSIDAVKNRIFGVELYAGLVENVEEIKGGIPAPADTPVTLFQRRCYMDEECLAIYRTGGMVFKNLPEFEEWLLKPENLSRIMPAPRAVVAFRVRREKKESEEGGIDEFVKMLFETDQNMSTYLYLKNGEQVYRLQTGIDFGAKLFPDIERSVLHSGKLYAVTSWGRDVERLATEGEYLDYLRRKAEHEAELEKIPEGERWKHDRFDDEGTWILWDHSTVFYDDISAHVKSQMEAHNRIVLVLQGLLDRSPVFQPHPAYKLWSQEDFSRAFTLVYDDSRALVAGDKPDFKAYQEKVNRGLRAGVVTVGQDDFWARQEAAKHNEEADRRYGYEKGSYHHVKKYRPRGDLGPGLSATVSSFSKKNGCTFTWEKVRTRHDRWGDEVSSRKTTRRITVPADQILCVATYKPGDYHIFYDDPRTRAEYLRWAPLLLLAEEWHATNGCIPVDRKTYQR